MGSATTLGGIIKHLRWVELAWFERVLAQQHMIEETACHAGHADILRELIDALGERLAQSVTSR